MNTYDDIMELPHWEPKLHRRMSEYERAAQFAPFSALSGYDAMVNEASRQTDSRLDPDDEQLFSLNETLARIMECLPEHPGVVINWFRKDAQKQGGSYVRTEGRVRNVDQANRLLILKEGDCIALDDIVSIILV